MGKLIINLVIIIMLTMIVLLLSFMILTKQNITYTNDVSCEELREAVLLDYVILEKRIENKFFIWEWEGEDKAFIFQQKGYYMEKCLE